MNNIQNSKAILATSLAIALLTFGCGGSGGGGGGGVAPIQITVSPSNLTIVVGSTTTFSAQVTGTSSTAVTWSVGGFPGGNSQVGTITGAGIYTAPDTPPSPNTVQLTATLTSSPSTQASAQLSIVFPTPQISLIMPVKILAGSNNTSLTVQGFGFQPTSIVQVGGAALTTAFYGNGTQLSVTMPASLLAQSGSLAVTVMTPGPGGATSAPVDLNVLAGLSVSPATATVAVGQTQQFSVSVSGTSDTDVTWSIDGAAPGDATFGTISSAGLYQAPSAVPDPELVTLRATSNSDNTSLGTALVQVTTPAEDWPMIQRDFGASGRSGETGISSSNVSQLQLKWKFDTGGLISASPAVATVGGIRTVYVGSGSTMMYALNADTGAVRWTFPVPVPTGCGFVSACNLWASPTVANGTLYFGTGGATFYALDAATGAQKWMTVVGDAAAGSSLFSSAAVYNGIVYTALATDETHCQNGEVVALDAATGAVVWKFDTIDPTSCPAGMSCSGAGVWATPTVDSRFGTLFVGTGNGNATCTGTNLPIAIADRYPDTLLALDLTTGRLKSYYQVTPHDVNDLDIGSEATLFQTQSINECTADDQVDYWVSVQSKNEAIYTFPRGPSGLLASPAPNPLDQSELVSSPAVVHFLQSQSCGTSTLQSKQVQANVYQPTSGHNVFGLRETGAGLLAYIWNTAPTTLPTCITNGEGNCAFFSSPAAINDVIFLGNNDQNIYALSTTGQLLWQYATGASVTSSPAISHGAVYFGSEDGFVYCFTLNGQ